MRRDELEQYRGKTVDDLVGPDTKLLFSGINPSLWTAAVNAHFARPGNRFWPALHEAGILDRRVDASKGMQPQDARHVLDRGLGITNVVPIATARADELSAENLKSGGQRLRRLVRTVQPRVIAVLGLTAYRAAFAQPKAKMGRQDELFEGVELWIAPNPSGLNAHSSLAALAAAYREIYIAAGLSPTE